MASTPKIPEKARIIKPLPAKSAQPDSVRSDAVEHAVVEPVEPAKIEPAAIEPERAPPTEPVPEVTISAVVSAGSFDFSALPLKTLDLLNENAAALFDFAVELGRINSITDAIELQSRFANERYTALLRQSTEVAELARNIALGSATFRHSHGALAT